MSPALQVKVICQFLAAKTAELVAAAGAAAGEHLRLLAAVGGFREIISRDRIERRRERGFEASSHGQR
jgi:hypothetical protein